MELELLDFHIDDIQWGDRTSLAGGKLSLGLAEIQDQIKDLTRNINVAMEMARAGESKRIVHVLDTMLPIDKLDDEGARFRVSMCPLAWSELDRPSDCATC